MKIYGTKIKEIVTIIIGILTSILFIKVIPLFLVSDIPYKIKLFLFFLYGVFVISGIGMILKESSRTGGILIVSISIPMLYHFVSTGYIITKYLLMGIVVGFLINIYAILRNRYDVLAKITKIFLFCIYLIYIIYIFYGFLLPYFSLTRVYELYSSPKIFIGFIGLGLTTFIFVLIIKNIRGIKASEMFVFGKTGSGKTYLMLALYNDIIHFYDGAHREVIISSSKETEEELRIESMLACIDEGHMIRSTLRNEVAMYILEGKTKGIIPVRLTVIDYGGEHTLDISKEKYLEVVLSKKMDIDQYEIQEKIGSISFLEDIKKDKDFSYKIRDIIPAYLYRCLENAGKIIFLIDGYLVKDLIIEKKKGELIKLFGFYKRLIDVFKINKKYAFVVTKTDAFKNIKNIEEDSDDAKKIEKEIYYRLYNEIHTFKEIVNNINTSFYFYTVSVDFTRDDDNKALRINPWRVKEVVKFGFQF